MRRAGPALAGALLAAVVAHPAVAQVTDLDFKEAAACRMNEIPLGKPVRIEARSEGAMLEVSGGGRRIVFYKDGHLEGEEMLEPGR